MFNLLNEINYFTTVLTENEKHEHVERINNTNEYKVIREIDSHGFIPVGTKVNNLFIQNNLGYLRFHREQQ